MILYTDETYGKERIIGAVASFYGIHRQTLVGKAVGNRSRTPALARHVAAYLLRHRTRRSLQEVARDVGLKNHTSVLHAVRRIEALLEAPDMAFAVQTI